MEKTTSHLLFTCYVAHRVWVFCYNWLDPTTRSYCSLCAAPAGIYIKGKIGPKAWQLIWVAILFSLWNWKVRSDVVFLKVYFTGLDSNLCRGSKASLIPFWNGLTAQLFACKISISDGEWGRGVQGGTAYGTTICQLSLILGKIAILSFNLSLIFILVSLDKFHPLILFHHAILVSHTKIGR